MTTDREKIDAEVARAAKLANKVGVKIRNLHRKGWSSQRISDFLMNAEGTSVAPETVEFVIREG